MLVSGESERMCEETGIEAVPSIFPERVRKTAINHKYVALFSGQDLKPGQSEYEAGMLPIRPGRSGPNVKS
jgi:hypothetical protein